MDWQRHERGMRQPACCTITIPEQCTWSSPPRPASVVEPFLLGIFLPVPPPVFTAVCRVNAGVAYNTPRSSPICCPAVPDAEGVVATDGGVVSEVVQGGEGRSSAGDVGTAAEFDFPRLPGRGSPPFRGLKRVRVTRQLIGGIFL
ncbi:hypothetical protein H6P81_016014 [Aristolochia fimbriata]|uniref:Uncharacterized protein n=1 Tax=Aristolochia fimbriata TaxID=158543 RepID=A0AAV7E7S4_ARIFI|nr:hypothetical protein H6P81_016014 [Aristolochia fimbriata]